MRPKTSSESGAGAAPDTPPERWRILIVDDDRDFVDTMAEILEPCGHELRTAHSVKTAREAFADFDADVALLDVRLGRGNGIDLIADLKQARPSVLCVMMTAYAAVETAIDSLHEGAYDYLRKPLNTADLMKTLDRCFEKLRLEREKASVEAAFRARNRELEAVNARLRTIVESTKKMTACLAIDEISNQALNEFARNMSAEGGSLFLFRENTLELVTTLDPGHAPLALPLPLPKNSIFARAVVQREALLVYDIEREKKVERSGWGGYKDGSLLVFPLLDESDKVLGIISLHNKQRPPFTTQDREFGSILASMTGEVFRALLTADALRKSEERFRTVINASKDAMVVVETAGRISVFNPAAEAMFGWTEQEMKEDGAWLRLAPEKRRDEARQYMRRFLGDEAEHAITVKFMALRKDGTLFPIEISLSTASQDNRRFILAVIRDMTEREQLEEQLRQAQKMEAIGQLAGGVAHDFNNLLQGILGNTQFALDDLPKDARTYGDLKDVLEAAQRAAALTRQLLAFSRCQKLQSKNIDLNVLVADLMKMLRRLIGENIELDIVTGSNLGLVHADASQIEQVLINLCVNARDAMPQGGKILIETSSIFLDETEAEREPQARPGRYVVLRVADSGAGMDRNTLDHIFEPFFTTKEVGKGTGLGLATVYGIVRQHNGFIQVSSAPEKGATFKICLPVVDAAAEPEQPGPEPPVPGGTETVLVAEDETTVRNLARRILKRAGYRVLTAHDGEDAIRLFDSHMNDIDMALLDVVMPKLSGVAVEEHIKVARPELPVLFSSGYGADAAEMDIVLKKGKRFLQKPYEPRDLLRKIRRALDGDAD